MLYMFRTVLVHQQEQLYVLYIAFGIWRYMPVNKKLPDNNNSKNNNAINK